jgi:hypothetical protein
MISSPKSAAKALTQNMPALGLRPTFNLLSLFTSFNLCVLRALCGEKKPQISRREKWGFDERITHPSPRKVER